MSSGTEESCVLREKNGKVRYKLPTSEPLSHILKIRLFFHSSAQLAGTRCSISLSQIRGGSEIQNNTEIRCCILPALTNIRINADFFLSNTEVIFFINKTN